MSAPMVIGVCGAGAMGSGIAQVAARAGHSVVVFDTAEAALERAEAATAAALQAMVSRGRLTSEDAAATTARILWTADIEALSGAGLVIEAIVEDIEAKAVLFDRAEAVIAGTAILATNTSSLPVTRLGAARRRPSRFLGLHFFNPAPVMKLVEVVPGSATDPEVLEAATALMQAWGKSAVQVRDVPGFIVNRVARPYYAEGFRAWDEGVASAEAIDALFREAAGFRMGPLELADMIGHDVNFAVARSVHAAYFGACRFTPQLAQGALVDAGRLGRKAGRGVYDYGSGSPARWTPVEASEPPPARILIGPNVPDALAGRLEAIGGVRGDAPDGCVEVDGFLLRMSDGRMAATFARQLGRPVAILDWAVEGAATWGFAVSDPAISSPVYGLLTALGVRATELADRPGLLVLRTLGQLANAAGDAARDRVSDADSIDEAMCSGANYPFGPLAWASAFGHEALIGVMTNIAAETGEALYQPSTWLRGRI